MLNFKSKAQKRIMLILSVLCLVGGAMALFLPSLLSTRWGNEKVLGIINARIPGRVEASALSLTWFGPQRMEGFKLKDPAGHIVLSFASLETNTSLLSLLSGGTSFGSTIVKALDAEIKKGKSGLTNFQESLGIDITTLNLPDEIASLSGVDLEFQAPSSNQGIKFKTGGVTKQGNVAGLFNIDLNWSENDDRCTIYSDNFPTQIIDNIVSLQQPELAGLITTLVGEAVDLKIVEESKQGQSSWTIAVSSKNLKFNANGVMDKGVFTLVSPAQARLNVTPAVLDTLAPQIKELNAWTLASKSEIIFDVEKLSIPVCNVASGYSNAFANFEILASVAMPNAKFMQRSDSNATAVITNFTLQIDSPSNASSIAIISEGTYHLNNAPLHYRFDAKINKPTDPEDLFSTFYQPTEIKMVLDHLPSSALDQIMDTDGFITDTLGESLSFQMIASAQDPQKVRMSFSSEKVEIPSILVSIDQERLFDRPDWSGVISIDKLIFPHSSVSSIHSVTIPWKISHAYGIYQFKFSGYTSTQNRNEGKFSGSIALNSNGEHEKPSIQALMSGNHLPAPFLELLSGRKEIETLFGPTLDLDLSFNLDRMRGMRGEIRSNLKGQLGSLFVNASIADKQIRLNEPMVLVTSGTEALGKNVLSQYAPVFNELISSDGPIRLSISPENFSFPIDPFTVENLWIGSAALEMGKLTFNNSGEIKSLISSLKAPRTERVNIWATPLYFMIQNGIVTVYRTDFLIMDKYPIATWGKIDLVRDDVQMVIGVTGTALAHAMDIQGIDRNAMVQIPVTGKTSNAKVNTTKATTKIGALVAQNSGSPEGLIIGTFLGLAKGKEAPVPPPTTNPLPWEGKDFYPQMSEKEPIRVHPQQQTIADPIREIKREAKNLFKGFLR